MQISIESLVYENERIAVRGFAVPKDGAAISVSLSDEKGITLPADVLYEFRQDVLNTEASAVSDRAYGFFLLYRGETDLKTFLVIRSEGEKECRKTDLLKLWKEQEKKKAAPDKQHKEMLSEAGIYDLFRQEHQVSDEALLIQSRSVFKISPSFLVVLSSDNPSESLFRAHVSALKKQTYSNFSVLYTGEYGSFLQEKTGEADRSCGGSAEKSSDIAAVRTFDNAAEAMADYVLFLSDEDIPSPSFFYEIVKLINEKRENPDLVYTDHDRINDPDGHHVLPVFKPDYSPVYLHSMNYIGQSFVVSMHCLMRAFGKEACGKNQTAESSFKPILMDPESIDLLLKKAASTEPYDRLLRLCDAVECPVFHLPKVLFSKLQNLNGKAEPEVKLEARNAISEAIRESFERRGLTAHVSPMEEEQSYEMHPVLSEKPLVSVLIPNKDHREDLKRCIKSLQNVSTYQNIEIIIIENNSETEEIFAFYNELVANDPRIRIVTYQGAFNYSAINNLGAREAHGEYLLLLNNDTEVLSPDFLESMVAYAKYADAGAVGAKLLYQDSSIQHCGVLCGVDGKEIIHMYCGVSEDAHGYMNRTLLPCHASAVTGACMLTPRALYESLGGLDEKLAVAYNDIEYCLHVQEQGYPVLCDNFARLHHFESKSRGLEDTREKEERLEKEKEVLFNRYPERMARDPYYNDNLSLKRGYFMIPVAEAKWLENDRDRLFLYTDIISKSGEEATVLGWAISTKHDVSFRILNSRGQEVPYTFETIPRPDASVAIMHSYEKTDCGFKLHFNDTDGSTYQLVVKDGELTKTLRFSLDPKALKRRQYQTVETLRTYVKGKDFLKSAWKEEGKEVFLKQLSGDLLQDRFRYPEWFKRHQADEAELQAQRNTEFAYRPKISLIVPAFRTPEKFLREMVSSVTAQTYANWELCVADGSFPDRSVADVLEKLHQEDPRIVYRVLEKNYGISGNTNKALEIATGEWIALMDHDDILEPSALYEMVRVMNENPETDSVYTDEDKISMDLSTVFEPAFKPDYDVELLKSGNYICHFFASRREIIEQAGEFDPLCDGAQDLDFILRTTEISRHTAHIPKILYHWRSHPNSTAGDSTSKMYCYEAGKNAVNKYLNRHKIAAEAAVSVFYGHYHVFYDLPAEQPLISAILWGNADAGLYEKSIESIRACSDYKNYEFIRAERPEEGTAQAKGEYLWFLQAGSEILTFKEKSQSGKYLSEEMLRKSATPANLLGPLMDGSADAVGAKVLDSRGTVYFGPAMLNQKHGVDEPLKNAVEEKLDHAGISQRLIDRQCTNILSLSNCMMTRTAYESAGNVLSRYTSVYRDFALSLELRRDGKTLILDPGIVSQIPVVQDERPAFQAYPEEAARFAAEFADVLNGHDPYASPNMMLHMNRYVLRESD